MRSPLLISILILAAPGIAHAGTRQEAKVLLSEDPSERKFQEDWGYADAIVAAAFLTSPSVAVVVRRMLEASSSMSSPVLPAAKPVARTTAL